LEAAAAHAHFISGQNRLRMEEGYHTRMKAGIPHCVGRLARAWLMYAWLLAGAPALLLAGAEFAARLGGYGADLRYLIHAENTIRPNKAFHQQFFSLPVESIMDWDCAEYMAATPKPANVRRVIVLGESAAYGSPFGGYGFARYLEMMLREAFPGIRIEVINAAVPGTNSNVLQVMASYFPELEPDVVLLYMGNNEGNPPFTSPALSKALPFIPRPMLFRAEVAINRLRLIQMARNRRHDQAPPLVWPNEDTPDNPALNDFEANLGVIVKEARRMGADVVLCTLGRNAAENAATQAASDISAIPRSAFNQRILAFARRAAEGPVRLVDFDRACWVYSGKVAAPGYDLFCDVLHFTFEGNHLLAASVFPEVAAIIESKGGHRADTSPLSQSECERRMGLGAAGKVWLIEQGVRNGNRSGKLATTEAYANLLRNQVGPDPQKEILDDFETALRLNPDDGALRVHFVRWLIECNETERAYQEAAELAARFPASRAANRLLAQTREPKGDAEGARRAYLHTLAMYPDDTLSRQALQRLGNASPAR